VSPRRHPTPVAAEPEEMQSYLVSLGDLLSGLLFVFIITLVVFALRLKDTQQDLKSELERVKKENFAMTLLQVAMEVRLEQLEEEKKRLEEFMKMLTGGRAVRELLLNDIRSALSEEGFQVTVDLEHGILSLPEEILFASGSATLQADGLRMLEHLAVVLHRVLPSYIGTQEAPTQYAGVLPSTVEAIFIEGHTDNIPLRLSGNFEDNWELSTSRAIRTYKTLTTVQPALETLKNEIGLPIFSVSGYADRRPVAENSDEIGRRLNRRIDVRFIMSAPQITPEAIDAVEKEFGLVEE
jgi:chemotaxis protein MotB